MRRSVPDMKEEMAERFAATAVDGLSRDQARQIVDEYHRMLGRCSVCNGTGQFTYAADVFVPVRGDGKHIERQQVAKGVPADCPGCELGGDPDHVAWHCVEGLAADACQKAKRAHRHTRCGPHLMIPWNVDEDLE